MEDETKQAEKKDQGPSDKGSEKSSKKEDKKETKGKRSHESKEHKVPAPKSETDKEAQEEPSKEVKRGRGKTTKHVSSGIAHINATFNNTLVTITDMKGEVIAWSSGGRMGFKGTRKSTAYAATMVAQDAARQASACRLQEIEVRVQGPGSGRESAIRALQATGLTISVILDVTPIPHNGCRARKRRRV